MDQNDEPMLKHSTAIYVCAGVILLLLIIAAIGYLSGAWQEPPPLD